MEGADLFGGEKRQFNKALKNVIGESEVDFDEFRDFVTNSEYGQEGTFSKDALEKLFEEYTNPSDESGVEVTTT